MPSPFLNNIQLKCKLVVPLCMIPNCFTVRYYRLSVVSTLIQKRVQDQEDHHGIETKLKQEVGNGTVSSPTMYQYRSSNTTIKSCFRSNIPDLEDNFLTEEHLYDATT